MSLFKTPSKTAKKTKKGPGYLGRNPLILNNPELPNNHNMGHPVTWDGIPSYCTS